MSFRLSSQQFRTMIFYDWKISLTYKDCHTRLVQAWWEQLTFRPHSLNYSREFQHNKFNVQDAPCSGRPSTSVAEQTIDVVRKLIEDDPHSTYQQIETMLGISSTPINSIIHDYLNLRKVCAAYTNR